MPAGKTYVKIASQTLGSAAASVTLSNLPQNYTDLVLIFCGTNASGLTGNAIRFNGDTSSNYSSTNLDGDGSSASSARHTNQTWIRAGISFTSQSVSIINIQNYANTTTYKTVLAKGGAAASYVRADVGLWRSTSAITSITYFPDSGANFNSGSTFTLYGIEAAKSPYAEGGDKVYSTGTHWVHEFYYSGTFVPRQNLTADYLVVAGGGGGGFQNDSNAGGGGGGAGGLRCTVGATGGGGSLESALSLTAQAYTVTIGAGGSGGIGSSSTLSTNGSNSVFSTITSTGGGRGGGTYVNRYLANSGGSGGGGTGDDASFLTGGAGTANQGYAGGNGSNGNQTSGGGGGAGAVGGTGANSPSTTSGAGGAGVATSISGSSVTYAGGGGGGGVNNVAGGAGGSGGGGAGGQDGAGTAGTTNTGGGGGGAGSDYPTDTNGGNGGSGIVIVRYAI